MLVKVFVLGLPGSGKSIASRFLMSLLRERGRGTSRFKDYDILFEMFQQDIASKQFIAAEHGGFDVIDPVVLDTALKTLEERVSGYMAFAPSPELILIEFARNNYRHSLEQFQPDFLRHTYFLFIQANIDTCIHRIHKRVLHPTSLDDHYVSTYTFNTYYRYDDIPQMLKYLETSYDIASKRVKIINNFGSLRHLETELEQFVTMILE